MSDKFVDIYDLSAFDKHISTGVCKIINDRINTLLYMNDKLILTIPSQAKLAIYNFNKIILDATKCYEMRIESSISYIPLRFTSSMDYTDINIRCYSDSTIYINSYFIDTLWIIYNQPYMITIYIKQINVCCDILYTEHIVLNKISALRNVNIDNSL
jgi:hypothetical protein